MRAVLLAAIGLCLVLAAVGARAQNAQAPSRPGGVVGAPTPGQPGLPTRDTAQKPQTGTAKIRGRVLAAVTNAPLRRVQMALQWSESPQFTARRDDRPGRSLRVRRSPSRQVLPECQQTRVCRASIWAAAPVRERDLDCPARRRDDLVNRLCSPARRRDRRSHHRRTRRGDAAGAGAGAAIYLQPRWPAPPDVGGHRHDGRSGRVPGLRIDAGRIRCAGNRAQPERVVHSGHCESDRSRRWLSADLLSGHVERERRTDALARHRRGSQHPVWVDRGATCTNQWNCSRLRRTPRRRGSHHEAAECRCIF